MKNWIFVLYCGWLVVPLCPQTNDVNEKEGFDRVDWSVPVGGGDERSAPTGGDDACDGVG